jgi:pyruvate carboxylase subunit B
VEVQVNGVSYKVTVGEAGAMPAASAASAAPAAAAAAGTGEGKELAAPLEGKFYLVKAQGEPAVKVGDVVKAGQTVCYIEAMKTFNAIAAECDGVITEICFNAGAAVSEDDVLMKIKG